MVATLNLDKYRPPDDENLSHIAPDLRPLAHHIDAVSPNPENLNHNHDVAGISASLKRYGQREVANANLNTGYLETWHGRYQAAKGLGWQYIAINWNEDTEDEATGFAIASNVLPRKSSFDNAQLFAALSRLPAEMPTGIEPSTLNAIKQGATTPLPVPQSLNFNGNFGVPALMTVNKSKGQKLTVSTSAVVSPPHPYFGGKWRIMPYLWYRLGDVRNLVDAFSGSMSVFYTRPHWDYSAGSWRTETKRIETANDADGFVANFNRALANDPNGVYQWCDNQINEHNLHARHRWLVEQRDELDRRLRDDPHYFDVKIAGWWVWGICTWLGAGWCKYPDWRARPHLSGDGMGINRLSQKKPAMGNSGRGANRGKQDLPAYLNMLSARLRRVRVCAGDWSRVVTPVVTTEQGETLIVFDPPYSAEAIRDEELYAVENLTVAHDVREWCLQEINQRDYSGPRYLHPNLKIIFFGYEGEHDFPDSWDVVEWKTQGGYARSEQALKNIERERVWLSPHCSPHPDDWDAGTVGDND